KKRYATAAELAGRLRLYLAGEPIPDRPPGRLERLWRAVRKRPLRSTAAALLGMALAGGLGAGYYFDPERPRREFAAALQSGRPYEFRGDERLPGPFRQVLGDAGPPQENRAEGCFSIETANISFWELMTDPTRERFRVSLEVRHDAAGGASLVGIYLGYRDSRTADGGRQGSFCTFTFADRGTEATIYEDNEGKPVSRALVRCCLFEEQAGRQPRISPAPTTRGVDFRPTFVIRGPAPWRKLAAEVTPEGTKTFWEGPDGVLRLAEGVPAEQLERHFHLMKDQRPRLAGVPTDYRPRAGIGLYVAQGKASFRHIVVRPTDGR
ncbi:MAG TPA: hypothetical protein VFE78_29605, partial [Gemmataceae bacterium]|nr:hypothetical protein [Gemmataceae bacterium]